MHMSTLPVAYGVSNNTSTYLEHYTSRSVCIQVINKYIKLHKSLNAVRLNTYHNAKWTYDDQPFDKKQILNATTITQEKPTNWGLRRNADCESGRRLDHYTLPAVF